MPSPLIIPGAPTQGWLILAGGGEFSFGETEEVDRFLLSHIPEDNRTIAFLPTASGSSEYATHLATYFRKLDPRIDLINVPVYRGRDVRRNRSLATLRSSGAIYIGGGVLTTLLQTIQGSPVNDAIREALESGSAVMAIGASATASGALVVAGSDGRQTNGLALLERVAIQAAFDPGRDATVRSIAARPEIEMAIGIPSAAAIAIAPDRTATILGSGNIAVVRKPPRD
ncbi:MAG TPA: Type 1 glutamine amidotransferase-like domain-containing protein [Thermoanaerobaculia bacterium]|nr:Type 1 glutamine amidotransferase-like domain-containing protein [Thermoanaerobaculia bacterium]